MAVVHRFIIPERRARQSPPERLGPRLGGAEIVILPCVRRETLSDWTSNRSGERTDSAPLQMAASEQIA